MRKVVMKNVDLLISARWVVPIAPDNIILENYAIVIDQGLIVSLLPIEEAKASYQTKKTIILGDQVLMPGLINAHAHTPMNLFRGLADDLNLMDWLHYHIWPAEQALVNKDSVEIGSRLAMAEMLRGGTTCFNDNYFFPHVTAKAAIEIGIRACLGHVIMNIPTKWAQEEAGYFERAIHGLENVEKHPLVTWTIAPHAPYTVSDAGFKKARALAKQYKIPIHLHLHETQAEVERSLKEFGKRPIQRIHELRILSPALIAVHLTQLTDSEIDLLQTTGTHAVHCPKSNLKLASGFSPVNKLLDIGVNVALGTDSAASNNTLDMLSELNVAAILAKAVSGKSIALPAAQALEMATLNGAKALGLDHKVGSLEIGKVADIIAIDLTDYFSQPMYNPLSHVAYVANRMQVTHVWVSGKMLVEKGELINFNTKELITNAKIWSKKAAAFTSNTSKERKRVKM